MLSQPKQGNYFMLPNEIFNMDLSTGEIAVYAFLMRMEDRKTFQCYPSFETTQQKHGHEICQDARRKRADRNGAHRRGTPRRNAPERKLNVQNAADKASGGRLPQTPA